MSQILYRGRNGATATLPLHSQGDVLVGGMSNPEWKKLTAALIPYTSAESGSTPNVSAALDILRKQMRDVEMSTDQMSSAINNMSRRQDDDLAEVKQSVALLSEHVNREMATARGKLHGPTAVGKSSNKALMIDLVGQVLRLDLNAVGSYDDSRTTIGASSVQGAFEALVSKLNTMSDEIAMLRNNIRQLNAEIGNLKQPDAAE